MATVTDIRHNPLSGNTFVDALLNQDGLNWNYVTDIPPNTIRYSFAAGGFDMADNTDVSGTATPFTAAQEAAARQALAYLTEVTGIRFQETTPGVADVHFANAAIVSERIVGEFFWKGNYLEDGAGKITRYEVDGVLYLDNAEFANYNAQPVPGSPAYQTLLHELGHMLGLKHPFDGDVRLPASQDNTANTLMSYTDSGGPYTTFRDDDLAALNWLYGGDGLGGVFGIDAQGRYLSGTAGADMLTGSAGSDMLHGGPGNDTLDGGAGLDVALFTGIRGSYHITHGATDFTILGNEGSDVLRNVERLVFEDRTVALDIDGTAGQAYRLYQAAFDRTPDLAGLGYWVGELDKGMSLRTAAANFIASPEFATKYGSNNPDNASYVSHLYENILHRAPEQAGYDYWLATLNSGVDKAFVLQQFSESPENQASVIGTIGNGFDYTPYT